MGLPLVLIGNDVHPPYNEMSAVQIQLYSKTSITEIASTNPTLEAAPTKIISIQSRKPIHEHTQEIVIPFKKGFLGRFRQLLALLSTLAALPRTDTKIIHYVGNGNIFLNNILALYALISKRTVIFSPLGSVYVPVLKSKALFTFLDQKIDSHYKTTHKKLFSRVLPPCTFFSTKRSSQSKPRNLLFCSVPVKVADFDKKGVTFLLRAALELEKRNSDFQITILNRFPEIAKDLEQAVKDSGNHNVRLQHESVQNMEEYMSEFSTIVIPFDNVPNVTVPMSVIEGFALGIPAIIPSWLPMAEDICSAGAGKSYQDVASFVEAVLEIDQNFELFTANAKKIAAEQYAPSKVLGSLQDIYKSILAEDR